MTNETHKPIESEEKRPGIWSAIAYFAGVAALVAGIWWVAGPDSTAPEAAPETTTTTLDDVGGDPSDDDQGGEPIADAAEIILPSVVRIDTDTGVGSGVIYDSDGLIITAAHVVADQESVRVRFQDGDQATGSVLGAATDVDIAVIQVEETGLPAAEFTFEKPRVGQMAVAVGSPWGLSSTVTAGIISAVDQAANCSVRGCASLVQTDAAINPGNSGGALVDRQGRVVGINVSIFTSSGANDGVGFAVPSEIALEIADSIVSGDPIETAFLGVEGRPVDQEGRAGALITNVTPGTAAEEAGIEVDDIIIFLDGVEIQGIADLSAQVRAHRPGDTVELILLRDGEEITMEVTLGVRPENLS